MTSRLTTLAQEWKALTALAAVVGAVALGSFSLGGRTHLAFNRPAENARRLDGLEADQDTLRSRIDMLSMRITAHEIGQEVSDSLLRQILLNQSVLRDTLLVTRMTQLQVLRVVCADQNVRMAECRVVVR